MADVALLGTGRMGAAMARRLAAAGHVLTVWNRTESRARRLAEEIGGHQVVVAASPAEAVRSTAAVLLMLADGEATRAVMLDTATLASLGPDTVVCDLGTSGVEVARALDAALTTAGVPFVDAPVSGSVPAVDAGTLLVMAGGRPESVDRARPFLAAFSRLVVPVGPAGAGQAMKLVVNLVVHDLNAALSEALVLAERAGIARADAYDVLQESVVAAPFVQYKRPAFLDPATPVAMSLDLVAKDLRLITALAERVGLDLPLTHAVAASVDAARAMGHGGQDMSAMSRLSSFQL